MNFDKRIIRVVIHIQILSISFSNGIHMMYLVTSNDKSHR